MKKLLLFCSIFLIAASTVISSNTKDSKVLVFTKTAGFKHETIPDGVQAFKKLGKKHGFTVDTTSSGSKFTEGNLRTYDAVVFLSTTGDVFNKEQKQAFKNYIQSGGGFVGVHSATNTEADWPWFGKLIGAYFDDHPVPQEAKLHIQKDENFPVTESLPDPWVRTDEWYNFIELPKDVHVLVSIDEKSYDGGKHGENHPLVWYHEYDGGRAFYTALGHTEESYKEPEFLDLLWEGLNYAMGNKN